MENAWLGFQRHGTDAQPHLHAIISKNQRQGTEFIEMTSGIAGVAYYISFQSLSKTQF